MPTFRTAEDVSKFLLTVELPRRFTTTFVPHLHDFADRVAQVTITIDDDGTAGVVESEYSRQMSPTEIRAVPWQQVIDAALDDMVLTEVMAAKRSADPLRIDPLRITAEEYAAVDGAAVLLARRARKSRRRLNPKMLDEVAEAYTAGGPDAVADAFFVSRRQANRYIARAREEGHLP